VRLRIAALHLLVLWAFAVAQPLFDLLGKNGEFFAARGSTRWDVVLFAVVLLFVPPAILTGVEALVPRPVRGPVHAAFVASLVALFVLQAVRGAGGSGWLLVVVAAAVGAGAALAYVRLAGARLILTVLAPAPLLFLGLFLLHSDASRLTFTGTDEALAAGAHANAPVVLVAFDELPVNSLLDSRGRIDAVRFPNFAGLAAGSTWFANTSTVAEGTTHAVPAILTGRFPRPGEFPIYTDHRQNLFTLLGGAADLHVVDDETHLCPPKLCPGLEGSFGGRMGGLAEDTGVVYLHQLLPDDLTGGIPSIANGWDNFLRDAAGHDDPGAIPPAFLSSLRPDPRPALWYVHFMLPHSPWRYLPSGRRYSIRQAPGWGGDEVWNGNQAAVDQYWQRHMLQLGYADRVLGRLLGQLRRTGLYERALVVVTADHGVSFRAGEKRRPLSDRNLEDIAYVPLFVKLPRQNRGLVERSLARTIDIVPTIADALGVRIPWRVDGRSLLGDSAPVRDVVLVKDGGRRFVVPAAQLQARRERALRRQLRLFGADEPLSTLYAVGPGRDRANHSIEGRPLQAQLDAIDLSSDPVQVSGRVPKGTRAVAVVVAGKVVAVAPEAAGRFWALVPRARLQGTKPQIYAIQARS
jgi:sulfatase-like protein